jgi:hypothetical protein
MKLLKVLPVVLLVYKTLDLMAKAKWWKNVLVSAKHKLHMN